MADTYIDAFEAVAYGTQARKQMRERVLPLHTDWQSTILRAITLQQNADDRVKTLLLRLKLPSLSEEEVGEVTDTIVRFGAWLRSLKGQPLDPRRFFGSAAPSTVARRRLTKVTGALHHMIEALTPHTTGPHAIRGAADWLVDLQHAHTLAERNDAAQKASEASKRLLSPEVESARKDWLGTYLANKRIVEGVLRHHDQLTLMPVIFDDLAEIQITRPDLILEDIEALVTDPSGDPSIDPSTDPSVDPAPSDPAADPNPATDPGAR